MRVKNNPKIFYLACGLLAEGDRRYDRDDAEIAALADKIRKVSLDADILQWFNLAKTGQVKENPYWPRGHAMLMAALFMEEGAKFDINRFTAFLDSINMQDPVGKEEFRQWINRLPEILTYAEGIFRDFWKEYCQIIFARTNSWMPKIEASRRLLKEFFGGIPNLVLVPNLFADPFAADFVTIRDDTVTVIACKPDIESMLREVFHEEVAKYRDKITVFSEEQGYELGDFADAEKMRELGYMQNSDNIAHVIIEECFVRALSAILAGGGERRLESHVDMGFTGLPAIGNYFREYRPKSDGLGDFIDIVLKGMAKAQ
jgi:hypothetical protein